MFLHVVESVSKLHGVAIQIRKGQPASGKGAITWDEKRESANLRSASFASMDHCSEHRRSGSPNLQVEISRV